MKGKQGFTLIEVLVVLAITAIVASLMFPVFSSAMRAAHVIDSVLKLKQLYASVQIYRADYDGSEGSWWSTSAMGLPPDEYWTSTLFNLPPEFWRSRCGEDYVIFETSPSRVLGWITYTVPFYADEILRGGGNRMYLDYLPTYRDNAVMFIDQYCNLPGTVMNNPQTIKRALSITLSGQLYNKHKRGLGSDLRFYSDLPDPL